jgi:hypothetical protein
MKNLTPTTVLVTGASSGIGRALVLEYGRRGAQVIAAARREAELASLCAEVKAAGGRATYTVCDVTDTEAAAELVRKAERELGLLDMVISNAGVGGGVHASRLDVAAVARMIPRCRDPDRAHGCTVHRRSPAARTACHRVPFADRSPQRLCEASAVLRPRVADALACRRSLVSRDPRRGIASGEERL